MTSQKKIIRVDVTRTMSAFVLLGVDENFSFNNLSNKEKKETLIKACDETVHECEWDEDLIEESLEIQGIRTASETDIRGNQIFKLIN